MEAQSARAHLLVAATAGAHHFLLQQHANAAQQQLLLRQNAYASQQHLLATQAAASKQHLLQQGLLLETPALNAGRRRGRPTVQLSLQASHSCFVGVSINEEKTQLAITDLRGEILGYEEVTEHNDLKDLPAAVRASFSRMLRKSGVARGRVRGAGIAVAGIVDADEGICRYSAGLDWRDRDSRSP